LLDYYIMLEKQGYQCPICQGWLYPQKEKGIHIDHDHTTGKVRGLLHNSCNMLLGLAHDNVAVLEAAIAYLNMH
jgi:Autographiviridae endonuclease VII